MKTVLMRTMVASFLFAGAALAQNSDLAILLGAAGPTSSTIGNGRINANFGVGVQFNYAVQLHETQAGQLYLELPLLLAAQFKDVIGNGVSDTVKDSIFFTPGVRWRFTPQKRVSFYAAAGAGIGSFGASYSYVGGGIVANNAARVWAPAFGFGGGIDFRLTRLLSLRAEGRDFVSEANKGGVSGHNHAFFMAGIGFHF